MTILAKSNTKQTSKESEPSVSTSSEAVYPTIQTPEQRQDDVEVNVVDAKSDEQVPPKRPRRSSFKRCCFCFDLRTGVVLLGLLVLLDGIVGMISNVVYSFRGSKSNAMGYPMGSDALFWFYVFCIVEIVAGLFGIYGGKQKNIGAVFVFYGYSILLTMFLLVFCVVHFAYRDWTWTFICLVFALLWIYWTWQIRKYYKILKREYCSNLRPQETNDRPTLGRQI
jgi:hypothetical protein